MNKIIATTAFAAILSISNQATANCLSGAITGGQWSSNKSRTGMEFLDVLIAQGQSGTCTLSLALNKATNQFQIIDQPINLENEEPLYTLGQGTFAVSEDGQSAQIQFQATNLKTGKIEQFQDTLTITTGPGQ